MICSNCGFDVNEELKFCPNCGNPMGDAAETEENGVPESAEKTDHPEAPGADAEPKKKKTERLLSKLEIERNYLLVYILGGFFINVFNMFAAWQAVPRLDITGMAANNCIQNLASFSGLPIFAVTVIFMLLGHWLKGKSGGNFMTMIGVLSAIAVELLMIFVCFFFGGKAMGIYSTDEAVVKAGITMLRWTGVGALIFTLVGGVIGFLFHWKRFWVNFFIMAAVLVLSAGLMLLGSVAMKKPMFLSFTRGMLQAGIILLPAIGFNVQGGKTIETEQKE
ncbi:MAG: hypothetical protein IKR59_09965 [Lachnospiraceae bacterium]|nr:hypothetical protein [Lachnospiraceae bacterium]